MALQLIPAVAYYRMSKEEQCDSIPTQREKTTAHFQDRYQIIAEYLDEGKSGSRDTHKRVDFLRMIHDVTEGRFKGIIRHILCLDLSRFGRLHTIRGARYKEQLLDSGIKLDTVIDGLIDWSQSTSRIIDSVKSEANHHLSLLIAEKGLQGRIRVTKEGRPNQTTPYGLAKLVTSPTGEQIRISRGQSFRTPRTWKSVFVPGDLNEVAAIRFMYQAFGDQDVSYNELARIMNDKGYPVPGSAGQWHGDTLTWMLQNPVYIGALRIGVTPKGEFFRTQGERETPVGNIDKPSPLIAPDKHERLINPLLWEKVQTKIQRNFKKRRPPRNQGPYSLSGIVYCGNCGHVMYASRTATGKVIYRCHRVEIGLSTCSYWIAYEKDLLPFITSQFLGDMREYIQDEAAKMRSAQQDEGHEILKKDLAKLESKLEVARERFLTAPPSIATGLLTTLEKMERTKKELQDEIGSTLIKGPVFRLLEWWTNYERQFWDTSAIELPDKVTLRAGNVRVEAMIKLPPQNVRERLKQIDTRISVWFHRKAKGRGYDLDKVRVQAKIDGEVCYEYSANAAS